MKIYLIPGLGYTHRIFENLDFGNEKVHCLEWIDPLVDEKIKDYANRMFANFSNPNEKIILIGHSLGAIMAQEIATIYPIEKVILISSIKSRKELPYYFKLITRFKIHRLFTKELSIKTVKYWGKQHGFRDKEELDLFKEMLSQQSNVYLQWALKALSTWKTPSLPKELTIFQIHGSRDKTFPIKLINKPDVIIENGGHIMLYKRAQEISKIIQKEID